LRRLRQLLVPAVAVLIVGGLLALIAVSHRASQPPQPPPAPTFHLER
jgi:hypothetical protein